MDMKFLFVIFIAWAGLCYASDKCMDGICEQQDGGHMESRTLVHETVNPADQILGEDDETMKNRNMMEMDKIVDDVPVETLQIGKDDYAGPINIGIVMKHEEGGEKLKIYLGVAETEEEVQDTIAEGFRAPFDNDEEKTASDGTKYYYCGSIAHVGDAGTKDFGEVEMDMYMKFAQAARAEHLSLIDSKILSFMKKPLPRDQGAGNDKYRNRFITEKIESGLQQDAFINNLKCREAEACIRLMNACLFWQNAPCVEYVQSLIAGDIIRGSLNL